MKIKPGVRLLGANPLMMLVVLAAQPIWARYGAEVVITSGMDGKHSRGSKHYSGDALDIRTRDLSDKRAATDELREALGGDYDVVLEATHCHCEYHPKLPYGPAS